MTTHSRQTKMPIRFPLIAQQNAPLESVAMSSFHVSLGEATCHVEKVNFVTCNTTCSVDW